MKKISRILIILLLTINIGVSVAKADERDYEVTMKQDILILMLAYPEYVVAVEKDDDEVYLIMKSGKKIIYDDKKKKSHEEKLENPDIQDMLEQDYPLEKNTEIMDRNLIQEELDIMNF